MYYFKTKDKGRAMPGSAKVQNVTSASGSVITYESDTVVWQESSPGWFTGYYSVYTSLMSFRL